MPTQLTTPIGQKSVVEQRIAEVRIDLLANKITYTINSYDEDGNVVPYYIDANTNEVPGSYRKELRLNDEQEGDLTHPSEVQTWKGQLRAVMTLIKNHARQEDRLAPGTDTDDITN